MRYLSKPLNFFLSMRHFKIILWTDEITLKSLKVSEGFKVKDINRCISNSQYIILNFKTISRASLNFINSEAINNETNPGAKSDIYRLEVS